MKICKVEDAVKLGKSFKYNWYRGHSSTYNNLQPRIFREEFYSQGHRSYSSDTEFQFVYDFKRIGPSLHAEVPDSDNNLEWLILMQHFGTPTRLLDWSESILVALFFAVIDKPAEDGELWSIYPQELNKLSGIDGYPQQNHKYLKFLADDSLIENRAKFKKDLGIAEAPNLPLAFYPTLKFSRMNAQQSVFTIHPEPSEGKNIISILTNEKYLYRYIIPKETKSNIIEELNCLGVCYRTLFMDLDNLSKDLINKYKNPAWSCWGQPDHPNFNSVL
ncbi:MAG: hypothetical protein CVT94_11335 [Bacteroidetes bacterium HGW-Bacteroidetes-11]|jgi:hypothetical protein|nr:MAG: hypothetical protein CVT94_11335 [Bacteroidetes bacterium HGW-Bacteroidetes-11]